MFYILLHTLHGTTSDSLQILTYYLDLNSDYCLLVYVTISSRVVSVPRLSVDVDNELGSCNRFLKRFEIAVINVDFKEKLPKDAKGDAVTEAIEMEDHRKGAALLNAIEEGDGYFQHF